MENKIDLVFYAVRNKKGKWLRTKGYGGYGDSWVDDIKRAKIYSRPGPAKSQITYWASHYPEFGTPDLIQIFCNSYEVVDQEERVKSSINKINRERLLFEQRRIEQKIQELSGQYTKIQNLSNELKNIKKQLDGKKISNS